MQYLQKFFWMAHFSAEFEIFEFTVDLRFLKEGVGVSNRAECELEAVIRLGQVATHANQGFRSGAGRLRFY